VRQFSCFRQQLTLLPVKFSLSTAVEPSHSRCANAVFLVETVRLTAKAGIQCAAVYLWRIRTFYREQIVRAAATMGRRSKLPKMACQKRSDVL
jgi:hypothetical protein